MYVFSGGPALSHNRLAKRIAEIRAAAPAVTKATIETINLAWAESPLDGAEIERLEALLSGKLLPEPYPTPIRLVVRDPARSHPGRAKPAISFTTAACTRSHVLNMVRPGICIATVTWTCNLWMH